MKKKPRVYMWTDEVKIVDMVDGASVPLKELTVSTARIMSSCLPAGFVDDILKELCERINYMMGDEGQVNPNWVCANFWKICHEMQDGEFISNRVHSVNGGE
jgi:hypothetical protein